MQTLLYPQVFKVRVYMFNASGQFAIVHTGSPRSFVYWTNVPAIVMFSCYAIVKAIKNTTFTGYINCELDNIFFPSFRQSKLCAATSFYVFLTLPSPHTFLEQWSSFVYPLTIRPNRSFFFNNSPLRGQFSSNYF